MPKRAGYLYERMLNKDLIRHVIIDGSKGKRKRHDVKKALEDVEGYTEKVFDILATGTFAPTPPRHVKIFDNSSGKERIIGVVPYFPDGIVHRLIVEAAKPIFMRGMYAHSCASIPGRGNMHAIKYVKKKLKNTRATKYTAKLDIRHYYPNLRARHIMRVLERKIKDRKFLQLIHQIITSDGEGLTIGFYLNQWLANVFLESMDHMIAACDGVSGYARNMDDMVITSPNKRKLRKVVMAIMGHLQKVGLRIKDNWQIFRTDSRGIDFVGYRFFHTHTLLRRKNFLKLTRQCRRVKRRILAKREVTARMATGLLSRIAQLKHCSGCTIRTEYVNDIGENYLKRIVRQEAKRQRREAAAA